MNEPLFAPTYPIRLVPDSSAAAAPTRYEPSSCREAHEDTVRDLVQADDVDEDQRGVRIVGGDGEHAVTHEERAEHEVGVGRDLAEGLLHVRVRRFDHDGIEAMPFGRILDSSSDELFEGLLTPRSCERYGDFPAWVVRRDDRIRDDAGQHRHRDEQRHELSTRPAPQASRARLACDVLGPRGVSRRPTAASRNARSVLDEPQASSTSPSARTPRGVPPVSR